MLVAALTFVASPAVRADVKVYDSTPPSSLGTDLIVNSPGLCPPISTTEGFYHGHATITDTGSGTVTLDELLITTDSVGSFDTTNFFGPGAFVFTSALTTTRPAPGQPGSGSTAPGGTVSWGILSGWSSTGATFCASSPTSVCIDSANLAHGVTVLASTESTTYDLGTWTFGSPAGDFEGTPYIFITNTGGTSNSIRRLRGTFVGASLPALPLVGFGALAVALAAAGGRALRRRP